MQKGFLYQEEISSNSEFNGPCGESGTISDGFDWPESRYYDTYQYGTSSRSDEYGRKNLGDATGEMGPFYLANYEKKLIQASSWYQDVGTYVYQSYPWFIRSGSYYRGADTGIFSFSHNAGSIDATSSFNSIKQVQKVFVFFSLFDTIYI